MPGITPSSHEIQTQCGSICKQMKLLFDDVLSMNDFLTRTSDNDLILMGIPATDIPILKSALGELATEKTGTFDNHQFVPLLWGTGV